MLRDVSALLTRSVIPHDPLLDRLQQILIVKGLGQKLQRTCFHRSHRHGNVAVTGEKNYRNLNVRLGKFLLQIEAT
jgi:hypothetical protein